MKRIVRFVFAGGVGFIVDAGVLALLLSLTPLGPLTARIGSIGIALIATWLFNRHLTFGPSSRNLVAEGARYGGVGIATAVVNYIVYAIILFAFPTTPPLGALVGASLVAMAFSFLGYSRLVFDR